MPEEIPAGPVEVPETEASVDPGKAASTTASIHEVSCSNCGAPLTYMQGEALITCEYCGTTTMLADTNNIVTVESHFLLPPRVGRDEAIGIASAWLEKGFYKSKDLPRRVQWASTEARVLPYWVVRSSARTMWRGMQKKTRSTGTGDKKTQETYWEPAQGSFSEDFTWPVYAREDDSEFWGIRNIEPGRKCIFPDWGKFVFKFGGSKNAPNTNMLEGKADFSIDDLKKHGLHEHIVNGQIVQERAERSARDRIVERHAGMADGKATRITDCDTTVDVQGVDLVYVPIWELEYVSDGKTYHVLVDASRQKVLSAEMPVGKWAKATMFDIVFFIIAAIFALIGAAGEPGPTWAWVLAGIFGGSGIAYTIWTATMKE